MFIERIMGSGYLIFVVIDENKLSTDLIFTLIRQKEKRRRKRTEKNITYKI